MDQYQNKYRIASARAPFWDYGWNAAYFVTICCHHRKHWFGEIIETQNRASQNGLAPKMELSPIGHIANSCWHQIPYHFPFVELGAHIIMPNHVHGIVIINKTDNGNTNTVETQNFASLPTSPPVPSPSPSSRSRNKPKNQFGPQSQNLASIIRGFKIGVTKNARQVDPEFAWQARYHDHIIRDAQSFQRISDYIINNPANWPKDKFYR